MKKRVGSYGSGGAAVAASSLRPPSALIGPSSLAATSHAMCMHSSVSRVLSFTARAFAAFIQHVVSRRLMPLNESEGRRPGTPNERSASRPCASDIEHIVRPHARPALEAGDLVAHGRVVCVGLRGRARGRRASRPALRLPSRNAQGSSGGASRRPAVTHLNPLCGGERHARDGKGHVVPFRALQTLPHELPVNDGDGRALRAVLLLMREGTAHAGVSFPVTVSPYHSRRAYNVSAKRTGW